MTLEDLLLLKRSERGLSIKALAAKCKISSVTLGKVETGKKVSRNTRVKILRYFNIPTEEWKNYKD